MFLCRFLTFLLLGLAPHIPEEPEDKIGIPTVYVQYVRVVLCCVCFTEFIAVTDVLVELFLLFPPSSRFLKDLKYMQFLNIIDQEYSVLLLCCATAMTLM